MQDKMDSILARMNRFFSIEAIIIFYWSYSMVCEWPRQIHQ